VEAALVTLELLLAFSPLTSTLVVVGTPFEAIADEDGSTSPPHPSMELLAEGATTVS